MSTSTATTAPAAASPLRTDSAPTSRRWIWAGLGSGVLGVVTTFAVVPSEDAQLYREGSQAVLDAMSGTLLMHVAASGAVVAAALLVPFGRGLATYVQHRTGAGSAHVDVVRAGMAALLASTLLVSSLRYIAAGGMPGGIDADYYTATDSTAMVMLASQMQFAAWLPGLLVTGALAHGALRAGLLPRFVGIALGLLTLLSTAMTLVLGLPYSAGLLVPLCFVIAAVALLRTTKRDA